MMAAVQPFLSMGISKTINLPNNATVEDIENVIVKSWELGLKCLAIYRDGSKIFQPLQSNADEQPKNEIKEAVTEENPTLPAKPLKARRMPTTREGVIRKFNVGGVAGYLVVGLHPDDNLPGEIFINISKEGSTLGGLLSAFGILFSIALQWGVPLEVIYNKLSYLKFEPHGPTGDKDVPFATSIIDYIVRRLAVDFLQKSKNELENLIENVKHTQEQTINKAGAICHSCGNMLQQTGTCFTCPRCGTAYGCG
jgi:ribonucleoside-diphosphate reductase alpha chain